MNNTELIEALTKCFPDKRRGESYGLPVLYVACEELLASARTLKENGSFDFSQLVCETVVDRTRCFELVCHLRSVSGGHEMILKTEVDREGMPELSSLHALWQSAELFEDEIYDLFGIRFAGHPNLRRLFLDDDFEGYPLRKDYVNKQEL